MIQKIKKYFVTAIAMFTLMAPAGLVPVMSVTASATIKQSLCQGSNEAAGTPGEGNDCSKGGSGSDPAKGIGPLAKKVVNFITVLVGAIAIIMIIVGGFRYITSGGDSGRVGSAKNTIIYAIIGLIIVALAQILVHFVINTAVDTGSEFK